MRRCLDLLLATVAILAVLCSSAWAGTIYLSTLPDKTKWITGNTYIVDQSITISERIEVTGIVTLMLTDGLTLSADKGINVGEGHSLTIEGGTIGTGRLIAAVPESNSNAAIGGSYQQNAGIITINGGVVEVSAYYAAGIGGGNQGSGGNTTINGGKVKAYSSGGAGIGGGLRTIGGSGGAGGDITINGGEVEASSRVSAGIGDGQLGSGGNITITGGTVTAFAKESAGIGGSVYGADVTITIIGGTVTATSERGAGIGGGVMGKAGANITISGGTVTATSERGAGIGGGVLGKAGANITISGGTVTATSTIHGIGIGNGFESAPDKVSTLSSSANGSACIIASSVGAAIDDNFNGVIFDDSDSGNGKVYGSATLRSDLAIPAGKTLEIPAGSTLTVKRGANLEIPSGTKLIVEQGAALDASKGTLDNRGTIENDGDVKLPETMEPDEIEDLGITGLGTLELGGKTYDNTGEKQVNNYDCDIVSGDTTSEWDARVGGGMAIVIKRPFADFSKEVWIDGLMLNDDEYTARGADSRYFSSEIAAAAAADAIKIMIADEVIKELVTHDGEHDLTVGFIDGEATLRFKVTGLGNAPVAPDAPVSPVSGGGGGCATMGAALAGLAALAAIKRRK